MKRLAKVQRALKAPKDQKGYGYTYRKASDILQSVKPLLEEDNLTILLSDKIEEIGGKFFLIAEAGVYAEDGQEIATASAFAMMDAHKGMSAEQATGSASSYARKYALCGLLAIDDSNADADDPKVRLKDALAEIKECSTEAELDQVINKYKMLQTEKDFNDECTKKRSDLKLKQAVEEVKAAKDAAELQGIWIKYRQFQNTPDFVCAKDNRKIELGIK